MRSHVTRVGSTAAKLAHLIIISLVLNLVVAMLVKILTLSTFLELVLFVVLRVHPKINNPNYTLRLQRVSVCLYVEMPKYSQ